MKNTWFLQNNFNRIKRFVAMYNGRILIFFDKKCDTKHK